MSEPRRHHLVPEHYLRRFANDRGQVKIVDRQDVTKHFLVNVKDALVERDFYAVERDGQRLQDIERVLSNIESEGAAAITRVLAGSFPPDPHDRTRISLFLSAQWLRGWDMREAVNLWTGHMVTLRMMNITRKSLREFYRQREGREVSDAEADELIAFAKDPSKYTIEVSPEQHLRQMLTMVPGLANLATARKWQLLVATRDAFVTSDAPVTLWTHPKNVTPYGGSGFGTADEIAFALGRRHALVLAHEAPLEEIVREVGSAHVNELNMRTALGARRYVVHHPDDDPLRRMTLPPARPKITISGTPFRLVPDGK